MDGKLLERLYEEWLHAKGWRQRETRREGAWTAEWRSDMGRLVGWHEAFPAPLQLGCERSRCLQAEPSM
jgi:hypothetical protein